MLGIWEVWILRKRSIVEIREILECYAKMSEWIIRNQESNAFHIIINYNFNNFPNREPHDMSLQI